MAHSHKILLVDDEIDLLRLWKLRLQSKNYDVAVAASGEEALATFSAFKPDVVLTDLRMPGIDGLALFEAIRNLNKSVPVIIITAHGSIPEAVEATRQGVFSFLTKPIEGSALLKEVAKAIEVTGGGGEIVGERDEWRQGIVSQSAIMEELLSRAKLVAETDATVLIRGESGTGKELLAIAIHKASQYKDGPFIPVNCTAIPETLLESELFGHVKGSFTGAVKSYAGLFQSADNGTLFLDEIGDMPLHIQVKLLRVLQDRQIRPVGSSQPVPVNVRIISATHKNLEEAIRENTFREDLFYRLNVVSLELPPLHRRKEDIPLLAEHFAALLTEKRDGQEKRFTPEAMQILVEAEWPGNIRQLFNVVENAVALATSSLISKDLLYDAIKQHQKKILPLSEAKRQFEQQYLIQLLQTTQGNVSQAARLAQRNRTDFYKLLNRHHIVPSLYKD
ncbi:sigma 54-interacting transcriptional regulator [Desulfobulbus oligotrophicus]|jgi:two-component system response regulator GlrR|uniref:Sigma 54-interacting transcriptional regulator n=1 Tax=Desulfobulbus oligotrophicus TaxID=1909699 RepID=A0A7T5VBE6_9BACT|nr:sigma 54-interacting transcriptional regulator [Desulfobulbus oligotrophicus]MDY0390513.1 sigma 54-interacting transcriptional regulator [Desulfobulbus oligotrophicus]QQG64804.1 sigma 54-interacting transcriptional regulator [Desulfobulbus oligotrophicus]